MLERLFADKWTEKRSVYSFILGMIFPIIGAAASGVMFQSAPALQGMATIFFCALLAMPTINKLFVQEEKLQLSSKTSFFRKHNHIIDSFLYMFAGSFVSFLIIGLIFPGLVIHGQDVFGQTVQPQYDNSALTTESFQLQVTTVLFTNMVIMLVGFLLSLVFGGGSVFLVMLTSGLFASSFLSIASVSGEIHPALFFLCQLGILITHGIPEVIGYLIAAISGGVLSQAIINEKWASKRFRHVFKDSLILLAVGLAIVAFAAGIEFAVSKPLYEAASCSQYGLLWIIVGIIILKALFWIEYHRQKHKKKKRGGMSRRRR